MQDDRLAALDRGLDEGATAKAKSNGPPPGFDDPPPNEGEPLRKLDLIWADDIEIDVNKPGLVDGLLGTTGMTVAYGESGCGKTFAIIDLACHVAAGMSWRGMDVTQGVVVYIAAEGPKSVERRVWAWKKHHGVEHLPLVIIKSSVDLLTSDTKAIIAQLKKIEAERGRIVLVVVDTLARAMTGNENAPEDMGRFVAACASIRDAFSTHVLIVHHTGKEAAKGARGHSSLRAATDVELEIIKSGVIRVTKARDEEEDGAYGFKLETVELGVNAKNRTITTCIAVASDLPPGAKTKRAMGKNEKVVFDSLAAIIADGPDPTPTARDIPASAKGASVARWRDATMRYLPQDEPKRKGEAFNRAITSLVADGFVKHAGGFAWLP